MGPPSNAHRKIGEMLVEEGKITASALVEALAEQKKQGTRLGEVLVHLKVLSEEEIIQSLARQMGTGCIDPERASIDPQALALIPEALARKYLALPVRMEGRHLLVAMAEPTNLDALGDLGFSCGIRITPRLASPAALRRAIDRYYPLREKEGSRTGEELQVAAIGDEEEEEGGDRGILAPVVRLANWILERAVSARASDIHIEPAREEFRIRFRIDGLLREEMRLPKWIQRPLVSRIKIMARLDISERRHPQDGAVRLRVEDREVDLRVSLLPTQFGEKAVLRILDTSRSVVGLSQVGFSGEMLSILTKQLRRPSGMILVTGPTGSGKTTTLYSMIQEIRSVTRNIVTVEDPIEYTIDEVNQTQVNAEIGLTFGACLRAILRQDPNVILIGEIRDLETAEIACRAALTGHLVLSTLHTNDAPSALTRLVDLGVPRYLVASVVVAVLAQRLVRQICPSCRKGEEESLDHRRGDGCERCNREGFLGRVGIFELLSMTPPVQELLMAGAPSDALRTAAISGGMATLREDGFRKAQSGVTTRAEILRVAGGEEEGDSMGRCGECGCPLRPDWKACPYCGRRGA